MNTWPDIHLRGPNCFVNQERDQVTIQNATYALEGHVAWDFEDNNSSKHKLVPHINCRLVNFDILGKAAS
jgi:hypothetical protein